jgi:phosphatidylserine decarboxylase
MTDDSLRCCRRLYVGMQYLLPHHLLSALMFRATRVRWPPFKDLLVRIFARLFRVNMEEALPSDPTAYESFNAFFTRSLRPSARPISTQRDTLACPADGTLSQIGDIDGDRIFQAKGLSYSLLELVGGRGDWAQPLHGGAFATIYLSPRDYHRVHMPLSATLRETIHVPGRLFSVNPTTTALVPRLFGRNERVLCLFEGEAGPMVLILVGAIFVGSMETVWAGQITRAAGRLPSLVYGGNAAIRLEKGEEMGRFNMGSTVVLLLGPGQIEWDPELKPGHSLRMGQRIGRICGPTPGRIGGRTTLGAPM